MEGWKKLLLAAGGSVGVAAALYYLLREDGDAKAPSGAAGGDAHDGGKKLKVDEMTKEQVIQILREIVDSQEKMRTHMKSLTKDMRSRKLDFDETYQKVLQVQPEDPLEKYGLSMMDFDQLLNKYQAEPEVREGIESIMGIHSDGSDASTPAGTVATAERIIEVHAFMLQELKDLMQHFAQVANRSSYDMKAVTLAAQAAVAAKVEDKFGLTSEDIEHAVIKHHSQLETNREFANLNTEMQQVMAQLLS